MVSDEMKIQISGDGCVCMCVCAREREKLGPASYCGITSTLSLGLAVSLRQMACLKYCPLIDNYRNWVTFGFSPSINYTSSDS